MLRIREVIVVEGRYDKNALSQVVDAVIVETSGFGIYNDAAKRRMLRALAASRGLIVLTDSDGAGFQIRSFIRGCVDPALVKHAYIPDVYGKERRKRSASKEGKKRTALLRRLDLPERLTADGLLDVLNATMSREAFYDLPL